jgi:hypothetical protein
LSRALELVCRENSNESSRQHTLKETLCYGNTNLVFENGHRDFVLSEHKFVLDNLKNTLIDTNLCVIFKFSTQNAKIPHKFVSIKVFFKLFNTKVCVLTTQIPCDRFRTQTFLECTIPVPIDFLLFVFLNFALTVLPRDLDGNQIVEVDGKSVRIKTEQL